MAAADNTVFSEYALKRMGIKFKDDTEYKSAN